MHFLEKNFKKVLCAAMVSSTLLAFGCGKSADTADTPATTESLSTTTEASTETAEDTTDTSDYQLEQMVILSRHNIRAPLSDSDSTLGQLTTHTWYDWSSNASELSLRGGAEEITMGQYFNKYLISKGLIPENWMPEEGQVRIYANSLQRTIATANYFVTGMLPVANIDVEYHNTYGEMDPVFNPQLTYVSDAFKEQAMNEIAALNPNGIDGITEDLKDSYTLLEDVLDFKDSPYAKEKNMTEFATDDMVISLEENKEPSMTGSLKLASSAADALTLQYYEDEDPKEAAFGKDLTEDQWKQIAGIKDTYQEVLMSTHSIAVDIAHPLLQELYSEMENEDRIFSYLCGHDSNITSVMSALNADDFTLTNCLNTDAPIGCKLVFEKWTGPDNEEYATIKLIYQSTEQLRNNDLLDLENAPMITNISLKGLTANEDGLYKYSDVKDRFEQAMEEYNNLP